LKFKHEKLSVRLQDIEELIHDYQYVSLAKGMQMPALFQHHPELPGKHCRRRKARTVFSDSQLSGLEKRFEIQRYLSTPERVELATALSLSETQVMTLNIV